MTDADRIRQMRRRLGESLAGYRDAAGLTQHQLAPLVYYGRSTVANAETGRQIASRRFWERCDHVLGAEGGLLAVYEAMQTTMAENRRKKDLITLVQQQQRHPPTWPTLLPTSTVAPQGSPQPPGPLGEEAVSLWDQEDTVELISRLTRRDLTLDRRDLARTLTAIACGSPLLEVLERWLLAAPEQSAGTAPGALGYQELAQIENAARMFRKWDDQFGGGLRRKAVIGQLNEVADLLRDSYPKEIRRRLFGALAQLSETAAIMSWDSGLQGRAQQYYALSFKAAKAAGDWAFGANVLAAMARQLMYLGQPSDALELVRMAQDISAGHATPAVRAMLLTREAWAYSKLGRVTAFQRTTEKAEATLADLKPANEPYWITYFDQAELDGTTGGRLLDLAYQDANHADAAVERISRAIELRRGQRLRSSALDQLGLAEARLLQGECEEAASAGGTALELVEKTPSDRVRVKLAELYRTSDEYDSVPEITQLRDRMKAVLAVR